MENATEALHMAFGVLIFVLALSISISLFSQVRATSQYILEANDRENEYIYVEQKDTSRIVGVETIVPAMYRSAKEEYIVVFKGLKELDRYFKANELGWERLYETKSGNSSESWSDVYTLNLEEDEYSKNDPTKFIDAFLNGKLNSQFSNIRQDLNSGSFYDIIKDRKFKETLGIYYVDDVIKPGGSDGDILSSDVNKRPKRVITYEYIP